MIINLNPKLISDFFKEEPALIAWTANGGAAALLAYIFHWHGTKEAAAFTILAGLASVATAIQARPAKTAMIPGTLITVATAAAAFGLHVQPKNLATVAMVISALLSLHLRNHLTPVAKYNPDHAAPPPAG